MYTDFKVRRLQKELHHISLNHEEDIEDEVEEDLEVEDEAKSHVIIVDSLDIWSGIVKNHQDFTVIIAKLRILSLNNFIN